MHISTTVYSLPIVIVQSMGDNFIRGAIVYKKLGAYYNRYIMHGRQRGDNNANNNYSSYL